MTQTPPAVTPEPWQHTNMEAVVRAASGNTIGVRWRPAAAGVSLMLAAGLAVGG